MFTQTLRPTFERNNFMTFFSINMKFFKIVVSQIKTNKML